MQTLTTAVQVKQYAVLTFGEGLAFAVIAALLIGGLVWAMSQTSTDNN